MNPPNSAGAVVVDSNIIISICSKENSAETAREAIGDLAAAGCTFYAPGAIVAEVLYILCRKHADGQLSAPDFAQSMEMANKYLATILPPPHGDRALFNRAHELRQSYSCGDSTDCIFIALAEDLTKTGEPAEILTLDKKLVNVAKQASSVRVRLLSS